MSFWTVKFSIYLNRLVFVMNFFALNANLDHYYEITIFFFFFFFFFFLLLFVVVVVFCLYISIIS